MKRDIYLILIMTRTWMQIVIDKYFKRTSDAAKRKTVQSGILKVTRQYENETHAEKET